MGYSMNWSHEYWGANIMDFMEQAATASQTRIEIINNAIDYCSKCANGGNPEVEKLVKLALSVFLTCPLREDPENLITFYLAARQAHIWVSDHFFKNAAVTDRHAYLTENNSGCSVGPTSCCFILNPLQRMSSSVSFIWTYDPDISLDAV
eukprot:gnl/TRDRNA2_/TRDRNA2_66687_c0_seq1.p1 gnl/TRDRNA2_/TRDRNA2_66687_c0~~gnl/TRDRNA2_/TRDRNA2_66687_c0_seq1.p1  ORF type:complete len:150 (-),score=14.45 gnl/TRDRNA2_/TRDRNA2_66687_c0_seq1:77-526(-)